MVCSACICLGHSKWCQFQTMIISDYAGHEIQFCASFTCDLCLCVSDQYLMLCFVLQMIQQGCLSSAWLQLSSHSWVEKCQNADSAESVEMLREVNGQLWILIGVAILLKQMEHLDLFESNIPLFSFIILNNQSVVTIQVLFFCFWFAIMLPICKFYTSTSAEQVHFGLYL